MPAWRCASDGSHTMRRENRPQRSAPVHRGRHLRDPIPHCRNAEGPLPAISLRDVSPPDRRRPIRACAQRDVERVDHGLHTVLLDTGERLAIDTRRAAVRLHPPPCLPQDVTPVDPIQQGMEAALRGSLGRDPQSTLQLAHFVHRQGPMRGSGSGRAGQALARPCALDVPTAGALPSRRVIRRDDPRYTTPSDARCPALVFAIGLYEPRCPDSDWTDGPLVFRSSPCTRAAPSYPAETDDACASGLRHRRHGLRRDMTGSALGL